MTRRVVVTGMSVVTALGFETSEFWDKLCAGKSGVSHLERFDCSEFKVHFGGELKDFDASDCLPPREIKRLDRFVQFAMYGAFKAIRQSGMDFTQGDAFRYGVITGSGVSAGLASTITAAITSAWNARERNRNFVKCKCRDMKVYEKKGRRLTPKIRMRLLFAIM